MESTSPRTFRANLKEYMDLLKNLFPLDVSKVYFHDFKTSFGGFRDVIESQRR